MTTNISTSKWKQPDLPRFVGLNQDGSQAPMDPKTLQHLLTLKLVAQGFKVPNQGKQEVIGLASDLLTLYSEQSRDFLENHHCPIDKRIQHFLNDVLKSTGERIPQLPHQTLSVDRHGLAKELSFPQGTNEFHNSEITSYRLPKNGVLHNPLKDKRTTQGVFHVADYGLPVPADKIAVPLVTFARLLTVALRPPSDLARLPYTANWSTPAETMVSLQLRPLVAPEVPGVHDEKRSEVRFFVPGGCVANLDFVESIFGNAGDPALPGNDAALDVAHWTGTTGCVILAPHLRRCLKRDVGLPSWEDATEQQRETGMCWTKEKELYNAGKPFKITLRDERGIMVTILADNYFGYCKKETKTQIGLTANVFGLAEEEHAGGALAFKSANLGETFKANPRYMQTIVPPYTVNNTYTFEQALDLLGDSVELHPEGYATDKKYPDLHILPQDMELNLHTQSATFTNSQKEEKSIRLLPNHTYIHPSGYKVKVERHPAAPKWRLVGTLSEPTFCHKPSTVSGGGKSEISKSLNDAVIHGPIFIGDYDEDMKLVRTIVERDYSDCYLPQYHVRCSNSARPILSVERTLGSVIKLLTPDEIYTPEHNCFVESISKNILAIVFAIKSNYKKEMGEDWQKYFTVDMSNGAPGHELKFQNRQLVGSYLRVGLNQDGTWRNYKLRQDFIAAAKVQMEDDITASIVVPREQVFGLPTDYDNYPSLKISENCEWRLFQRPDDAIHPGFDKQTEIDMSGQGLFCSNFEPIESGKMKEYTEELYFFDLFTKSMQDHMEDAVENANSTNICSAKPRIVEGKPTKNPRYLQVRPDVVKPKDRYLAELGSRLYRRLSNSDPCIFPVAGVLSGRRNNPPDELDGKKIRPLCIYNPIHYQELPELLMDYVCCVTGKSPSTTGAGSEGALSKGPFNAIGATADLNNMLVSMILTGYGGFSSAAGWIGPKYRVDHDISLIVPELWCRMTPQERDPTYLIQNGFMEQIDDFEFEGQKIPASRLGYRITKRFAHYFGCRIFDNPSAVFTEELLKPELQDVPTFVDGIQNICQAMEKSALLYFKDGIINDACPPLRAVLHVMAYGHYHGKSIRDPEVRRMFTRETVVSSRWYRSRLVKKQTKDQKLWSRHVDYLDDYRNRTGHHTSAEQLQVTERLAYAKKMLQHVNSEDYLKSLEGTLGADPIHDGYLLAENEWDIVE